MKARKDHFEKALSTELGHGLAGFMFNFLLLIVCIWAKSIHELTQLYRNCVSDCFGKISIIWIGNWIRKYGKIVSFDVFWIFLDEEFGRQVDRFWLNDSQRDISIDEFVFLIEYELICKLLCLFQKIKNFRCLFWEFWFSQLLRFGQFLLDQLKFFDGFYFLVKLILDFNIIDSDFDEKNIISDNARALFCAIIFAQKIVITLD